MRKISEIKKDLATELKNFKTISAAGDKDAIGASRKKLTDYQQELKDAELADSIEKSQAGGNISEEDRVKAKGFSFAKFIREAGEGNLTGLELEMSQLANKEASEKGITIRGVGIPSCVLASKRAQQTVGAPASGGVLVGEEPLSYIEALRKKLALVGLGATFIPGLRGNLPLVKGGSFKAGWYEEGDEVNGSTIETTKHVMKPRRLSVMGSYSADLLNQASIEIDTLVMNELISAHAIGLEEAALNGDGVKEPLGLLNNEHIAVVVGGVNGAVPTFKNMVQLETEIAAKDADLGKMAYLVNARTRGCLKTTEKAALGAGFVMMGDEVNGYKAVASNIVPSNLKKGTGAGLSAVVFGVWSDLVIGQWGGLDVIVDPYHKKKANEIEVVLHAYHDVAVRNNESFSLMKDIITE